MTPLTPAKKIMTAQQNNRFAIDVFKKMAANGNTSIIMSPLSITYAVSMIGNGAQGQTYNEIAHTLGMTDGQLQSLNELNKQIIDDTQKADSSVQISVANAIFLNKGCELLTDFRGIMDKYYQAETRTLDFSRSESCHTINQWCNEKTKGMIPKMLDELNPAALSYVMNALYFKGLWMQPFAPESTCKEPFHLPAGKQTLVEMMHQKGHFNTNKNETFQTLIMPYGDHKHAMVIMLPKKGKQVRDILNTLNTDLWNKSIKHSSNGEVIVSIPKFKIEHMESLNEILQSLGMNAMFDGARADFSRMSKAGLSVSQVMQKAKIEVDEVGSKAAAVTGIMMTRTAVIDRPEVFNADHPFVYAIVDMTTDIIYFMGVYAGQ